jgi:hypothetical protein
MKTKLQVTVPGEPDRHYPIDTRAIVGKGPTADVSLDHAAAVGKQHFRIKLGPTDLDVRIAPGAAPLTYEGRPFSGGPIPYGSDFYLDRIRFSCLPPNKGTNAKLVPLLAACVLVIGGFIAFDMLGGATGAQLASEDEEVVLFTEGEACPQTDPAGAARKGQSLELAARAKRERYRYDAHDGLDAGRLFSQASKCYALAGDQPSQARVDQEGQAWRQRVTEEFRAAQLRWRTAVQNNQNDAALTAVVAMRRVLQGEPHPYMAKLAARERQLRADLSKKK